LRQHRFRFIEAGFDPARVLSEKEIARRDFLAFDYRNPDHRLCRVGGEFDAIRFKLSDYASAFVGFAPRQERYRQEQDACPAG
jgi:hypothetical protein